MFVFIPTTAIWACGLIGGLLLLPNAKCCLDYQGRPNFCCAKVTPTRHVCTRLVLGLRLDARLLSSQALSIVALVLHAIIAYVETFLMANFPGWIIGVLITKNVLCIVGEITALVGACMLERAQTNATQAAYAAQRLSMGQPQQQAIPLQVVVQPFGGAAGGGDRA